MLRLVESFFFNSSNCCCVGRLPLGMLKMRWREFPLTAELLGVREGAVLLDAAVPGSSSTAGRVG